MIGSSTGNWVSVKDGVVNGCRLDGTRKRGSVGISAEDGFALMSDAKLFEVDHYNSPDGSIVYVFGPEPPLVRKKGPFKSEMV